MNRNSKSSWLLFGLAGLALVFIPQIARAERLGGCIRAEVPAPIVLPDGRVEQAGELKICLTRLYSPVSGLHKTSVNGHGVGIFISNRESVRSTDKDQRPYFVFIRNGGAEYELVAYALRDGDRLVTYTVGGSRVRSYWTARRKNRQPQLAAPVEDDPLILLAANLR
jgi:hypothetical protein